MPQEIIINLDLIIEDPIELDIVEDSDIDIVPSGRPINVINPFDEELTDLTIYYNIAKL